MSGASRWGLTVRRRLATALLLLLACQCVGANLNQVPAYQEAMDKIAENDWKGAYQLLKGLQKDYSTNPEFLNNMAVVAARLGQSDLAVQFLERAILSHPVISVNYSNLQSLYTYKTAQEYKKALSLDSLNLSAPQLKLITPDTQMKADINDRSTAAELILAEEAVNRPLVDEVRLAPENDEAQIALSLQQWADAWSSQDLNSYFASYIENYRPRSGASHQRWRKLREGRIVTPRFIDIRIADISIKRQDDDNALVTFKQHYRSNLLRSIVFKELEFYRTKSGWKIKSERVIAPA